MAPPGSERGALRSSVRKEAGQVALPAVEVHQASRVEVQIAVAREAVLPCRGELMSAVRTGAVAVAARDLAGVPTGPLERRDEGSGPRVVLRRLRSALPRRRQTLLAL